MTRRESRIPKMPPGGGGPEPLAEKVSPAGQQQLRNTPEGGVPFHAVQHANGAPSASCDTAPNSAEAAAVAMHVVLQSNVMDKKRRGGPLEGIPEAKRPTRTASARSDRSATAPAAAAGRSASTSAAAGRAAAGRGAASAAAPAAAEAAPKAEETWEDIAERTGMTADDVLNR